MATLTRRDTQPAASTPRLAPLPRERHPALAALGALLVVVGALGGLLLQQRAGDRIGVIQVTARVPAGENITAGDIRQVAVASNPDIAYVRWAERGQLSQHYTQAELLPGTVLTGAMLTTEQPPADGQVLVGLSLSDGQYPTELQVGDHVTALYIGDEAGWSPVLATRLRVFSIAADIDDDGLAGNASVSLVVAVDDAPALAAAANAGDIALALLPEG